jgi:hypothetical protein
MTTKTISVSLGRVRLPLALARQLRALTRTTFSRVVALTLRAHLAGVDVVKLANSEVQLRHYAVLLNLSLKASGGAAVDPKALDAAVRLVNSLCR